MVKPGRSSRRKSVGLVLHQGGAGGGTGGNEPPIVVVPDARVEVCGLCQGPSFLCRLDHDQAEPADVSPIERRWLAALRAVHVGVALCSTPGAGMGGALLTLGRGLVTGTAMPDPDTLIRGAADPGCRLPATLATTYALAALVEREALWPRPSARASRVLGKPQATTLDVLQALSAAMGAARARWVREIVGLANRAALASPFVVHETFPLVAAVCRGCAGPGADQGAAVVWENFMRPAELYDNAIRCPMCQRLNEHPLPFSATNPRLPWPGLHPVGRCQRGECATGIGCVTHDLPVGPDALCGEGRHLYQQAQAHIAVRMGERTALEPWESRVLVALVMARQPERARRATGAADDTAAPQSFAEEFAEAFAQMRHDMQRSLPLLARILPAPVLSLFGLLDGPAPKRSALTKGLRFDLTAIRGGDSADYANKDEDEAETIERDSLGGGLDRHAQAGTAGAAAPKEAEVTIADELRKLVSAGANVLDGLGQLEEAADALVEQAGPSVEHMAAPATLERAVVAGVAAAASTLGQEAARAAVAPGGARRPARTDDTCVATVTGRASGWPRLSAPTAGASSRRRTRARTASRPRSARAGRSSYRGPRASGRSPTRLEFAARSASSTPAASQAAGC